MAGSSPVYIRLISDKAPVGRVLLSQTIEKSGFMSLSSMPSAPSAEPQTTAASTTLDPDDAADLAWEKSAIAERTQRKATSLQGSSTDLLRRLPFDDAVMLAALVGTGQMTWRDINAALEAKIKLATLDQLKRHKGQRDTAPQRWWQSDETWATYDSWHGTKRIGESEIWARYNAGCDQVFANDPGPSDMSSRSLEQLLSKERILDRLRSARDRELAELVQRLGPQPPRPADYPACLKPYQIAMLTSQLTSAESDALRKLDARGFIGSADMATAISTLAAEIADNVAGVT